MLTQVIPTDEWNVVTLPVPVDPLVSGIADLVAEHGYEAVLAEVEMHAPLRVVPR